MTPLQGLGVLVTRPEVQAGRTAKALSEAGAEVFLLPALALEPIDDASLDEALAKAGTASMAIFVSANAAEFGLAALRKRGQSLTGARIAAIGAATQAALAEQGLKAEITPLSGHDSEALLAHSALQAVAGQPIILFRGHSESGGRKLLAETLRQRGAVVIQAECYRRTRPDANIRTVEGIITALAAGRIQVIQAMSVETLDNLLHLLGDHGSMLARTCRLVVPHARIATRAREAGFTSVEVTGLKDTELIAALSQGRT